AHVEVDDSADFDLPLRAVDLLQLARRAQRIDPSTQVLVRRLRCATCRALGGLGDGLHLALLAYRVDRIQLVARTRDDEVRGRLKSCFSRCGVPGNCVTAPGIPMASSMADAIAAPTPVIPLSPAPLMPRGLSGLL